MPDSQCPTMNDGQKRQGKVLVLGQDTRAFLTVIRSLGRRGVRVHVGWHLPTSVAVRSRYVSKVHDIPRYLPGDDRWKDSMTSVLKHERFDLVIPCNDGAMYPIQAHREEFEQFARLAIPKNDAFRIAFSKFRTVDLARSLDIPVPQGERVTSQGESDRVVLQLGLPVVVKPEASFRLDKPDLSCRVHKARSQEQLRRRLQMLLPAHGEMLIQENFVGTGVGVEVLADGGDILLAFQHLRVHEPLGGGGSTYRKSVAVDPDLLDAAGKLMKALDYTGVAMVEYKVNRDLGAWVLVEINGRFWGSLPLAVAAGADFPYNLYQFMVEGRRNFPQNYRTGIYCRNLVSDLAWVIRNFRADKSDPTIGYLSGWRVAEELANILTFRERSDTFVKDDLAVGLFEVGAAAKHLMRRLTRKPRIFMRSFPPVRALYSRRIRRAMSEASSVLFVCKGNICRSPFAERYARTILPASVRVAAAGYYPIHGRPSPEEAVEMAKEFGVNLDDHSSEVLNEEMVRRSHVIFAFDGENYDYVRSSYPFARRKIHLLGVLNRKGSITIQDPYGKDRSEFRAAYAAIAQALAPVRGGALEGAAW